MYLNRIVTAATQAYYDALSTLNHATWRQGHSEKCNIYACIGVRDDQKDDPFVGRMGAPAIAAEVVRLHNDGLI